MRLVGGRRTRSWKKSSALRPDAEDASLATPSRASTHVLQVLLRTVSTGRVLLPPPRSAAEAGTAAPVTSSLPDSVPGRKPRSSTCGELSSIPRTERASQLLQPPPSISSPPHAGAGAPHPPLDEAQWPAGAPRVLPSRTGSAGPALPLPTSPPPPRAPKTRPTQSPEPPSWSRPPGFSAMKLSATHRRTARSLSSSPRG